MNSKTIFKFVAEEHEPGAKSKPYKTLGKKVTKLPKAIRKHDILGYREREHKQNFSESHTKCWE